MDKYFEEALRDRTDNYVLPFLWMHDGHHDELPALVESVYQSGAREFCVESRPHGEFCKQGWWDDMDVVLAEAEKRGMKVWILDDKHFPTGYANGFFREKYPEKRKWQLVEDHVDVIGPAPESAILLTPDDEDVLLGAYAFKRSEPDTHLPVECVDLTRNVRGRYLYWDIPKGVYRVFLMYKSRRGGRADWMDALNPESVDVLIEAVYEPHYAHYGRYFGSTVAGFFSDEPSFGNERVKHGCGSSDMYDQKLGQPGLALPWSDRAQEMMSEEIGQNALPLLPALWYEMGDVTPRVRVAYMNAVTKLWRENFSFRLGAWCRARGVEYIGHIIEDMNAHMRLSCSAGHYFRALEGQDMSGIDVVLHQIVPGFAHFRHNAVLSGEYADPEFFDYVLARLAASLSHIEKRMKGRAMCEIFGAYGWAEGVPFMKMLLDHMLVRGVNRFVPHAFSPKYPDPDCPPHFNAGGCNPQFEAYSCLMRYLNRVVHLLEDARETVSAAILYNAEAEWAGRGSMPMQKPAKAMYDMQLNYDFLPCDAILEKASVKDGCLFVEDMKYPVLVVPYSRYLPAEVLRKFESFVGQGLKIAFADGRPDGFCFGDAVSLSDVADYVSAVSKDVTLETPFPLLRCLHKTRGALDIFMFVNESMEEELDTYVRLPVKGWSAKADFETGSLTRLENTARGVRLKLARGRSVIVLAGDPSFADLPDEKTYSRAVPLSGPWTLSLRPAEPGSAYGEKIGIDALCNVCGPEGNPDFSGFMKYETEFDAVGGEGLLDLGTVGECVKAKLNGTDLGVRIAPPYTYDVCSALRPGRNLLELEISNNLVHKHPDVFSHYIQIGPSGLIGPVKLWTE